MSTIAPATLRARPDHRVGLLVISAQGGDARFFSTMVRKLGADLPPGFAGAVPDVPVATGAGAASGATSGAGLPGSSALIALNDAILASGGSSASSLEAFNDDWYKSPRYKGFHDRAVALIGTEFPESPFFALADPRIARLLPFWLEVLRDCGIRPAVVLLHDSPAASARALEAACGLNADIARLVWLRDVLEAERATRGLPRSHVSLSALLADWETVVGRMAEELDLAWPAWSGKVKADIADSVRAAAAHGNASAVLATPDKGWVGRTHRIVQGWAKTGENPAEYSELDDLRTAFDEAMAHLGGAYEQTVQRVDGLLAQVAELECRSDEQAQALAVADSLRPAPVAQGLAAGRATGGISGGERDLPATLAAQERYWADAFREELAHQNNLREQNDVFQKSIEQLSLEASEAQARLIANDDEIARLKVLAMGREAAPSLAILERNRALTDQLEGLKKDLDQTRETIATLRRQVEDLRAEIGRHKGDLTRSNALIAALRKTASEHATLVEWLDRSWWRRLAAHPLGARRQGRGGAYGGGGGLKSLPKMLSAKGRRKMARLRADRQIVLASGMFDAQWYAERYPDIVEAGADPLDHFIQSGGAEGRHPSENFNSKWYLDQYSDVRQAGMNPLLHYLKDGQDEGRLHKPLLSRADGAGAAGHGQGAASGLSPRGGAEPVATISPPRIVPGAPGSVQAAKTPEAGVTELDDTWRPSLTNWKARLGEASLRRRSFVNRADLAEAARGNAVALGSEVFGFGAKDGEAGRAIARLRLFAELQNDGSANTLSPPMADGSAHDVLMRCGLGLAMFADAWFDGETVVRMRLANADLGVLRAYQMDRDGKPECLAEILLMGTETDLAEIPLANQMTGLLLVLTDDSGNIRETAVLPFPSLLRGGLHHAETAAVETAPGYHQSLIDYATSLALELYGWPDGPADYSVGAVSLDFRGATGIEPIFRPEVVFGLARQYGLAISPMGEVGEGATHDLAARLHTDAIPASLTQRKGKGGVLTLPADALPSIYSMVARRAAVGPSVSMFACADAATLRPRALVSLPILTDRLADLQDRNVPARLPQIMSGPLPEGSGSAAGVQDGRVAPVAPLAVRFHDPVSWQFEPLMPVSPDQDLPAASDVASGPGGDDFLITAIVDMAGFDGVIERLVASLARQTIGTRVEVVFAGMPGGALPDMADRGGLPQTSFRSLDERQLTRAARLNAAAAMARAPYLLIVDPEVVLADPRALALLVATAQQPDTATAACALVTEGVEGEVADLHTAGFFPTRISLAGDPVFEVDQTAVGALLPASTYPVAANQMRCCLIDAAVWRTLGGLDALRFPAARFDLDFGVRALAEGYANYCTTLVRAADLRPAYRMDFPDPLAHRSIHPARWQALFDRVTVIRDLIR